MHVITGGTTNNIDFSCMYNASNTIADKIREENGNIIYGFYGIAHTLNDAPAIVWLDKNLEFVKGELINLDAEENYEC